MTATSDATATAGQDYDAVVGGSLVIPAGKTDTTIVVGTIDDALSEEAETFVLTLEEPEGADLAVGAAVGTGTIEDNDDAPTVSIGDAPLVTEGVDAVFAVKLSEASGREVTVPYATSDATATAGQDYDAVVGGSLVIPAGKTDTTIVVGTIDDALSEETETFVLTLEEPEGADLAVGAAVGTGTIEDNDDAPTVSIGDAPSVTEGVDAVFAVKLSEASGQEVTVPYATSDATATAGQDYDAVVGGSLVIPAGKTDTTIVVGTIDDALSEETETFTLTLQDPVGADLAVGAAVGTGTIEDNDDAPTVSIEDAPSVTEGVDAVFAVKLSEASGREVTVPYATSDATATAEQDYDAVVGGSLVIPAGKTDTTIVVGTIDDALSEEAETFVLTLEEPEGADLAVGAAVGTGTIEDNDEAPVVSIEDAPLVTEGVDAVFAVKLSEASGQVVTVPYATSDATATAGQDYDAVVGGSLVIPAGKTDTTIVVGTIDDALSEEAETFVLTLEEPEGADLAVGAAEGTGTILDNDDAPTVSIEDAPSVTEGVDAVFAVKLSVASGQEVTVPYATSDATATAGQDYDAVVGGSLVIPAGKTDTTIVVGTTDDVLSEETETFVLTLQDPEGADLAVGGAEGTGTILDNDDAPTVSIEDAPSVMEGVDAVFAVKLSEASGQKVTVPYATSDASATAGQDYDAVVGGSLVIPAGKTDTTIVVGTIDDALSEETETFTLTLQDPVGADLAVGAAVGTGTIEDNDDAPVVSIEDAPSVTEGVDAVFAVKLSEASGREVTVPYATSDATATAGQDYDAVVGGSLVIPAGKTDTTIVVGTIDDALSEETETFTLTLQDPVGADLAVGAAVGTGTIEDNDDAPVVSIEDAPSVTEGVDAVFAVKLSEASGREVTVPYATSDATATAGQDYDAVVGGSLVIPAGKTDTTIVVGTIDDALSEEAETFVLTLEEPEGADLAVGAAVGTILDNDGAPTVSIEDAPLVTEGVDAVFAVKLSEASGREVTVPYATSDATATAEQDYDAVVGGSLVIPAGKTDTTIVVGTIDDALSEEAETFVLTLEEPEGADLAVGAAVGTGTIEDNDEAPVVSIEDAPLVTEGVDAVFAVKLSEASGQVVTVPYATSDATATAGQDYDAAVGGSLVIPAGKTDTTIVVGTIDDVLSEETETFVLTLQDPVGANLAVGAAEGTGTILDNDGTPTVSIEDAPSVTEGVDAVFAVKLSVASGQEVTVPYETSDATATAGQDYEAAVGGSLVIPAGKTDTTIVVGTSDDALSEETETFVLTLQDPVGADLAVGAVVGTGTILDNDDAPILSIEDADPVTEGVDAVFAVKLSEASGQEVTVSYTTVDVTATAGQDYDAVVGGSLVIPAGKTDTTIVVGTTDDDLDEEDTETFTLVLSAPLNATLDEDEGTGTILDNDDAPTVSIEDAPSVTEGVDAVFAVKLNVASALEVTVPYETSDATATAGQDYDAVVGGSLVIPAGKTDTTIVVGTTDDVLSEETETFVLTLQDPVGANLAVGAAEGTGTILDNDGTPTVSIEDAPSVTEGVDAVFAVKLSVASGQEVTVPYETSDATATAGQDYEAAVGGSLVIPAGKTDTTIVVGTSDDALSEETETFVLTLQDPVGADLAVGAVVGTGTILDNDDAPILSIEDADPVTEGVDAVFAVKLSEASGQEVTVSYTTVDVTATAGQDYDAVVGGSLVIPAGKTDTTIVVGTTDDDLDEEDTETFTLVLSAPLNATLDEDEGTGTILDNDDAPTVSIEDAPSVTEGVDAVFAVKLNVASALEVTVPYETSDATATAGQDYEAAVGGSLVIPAGKTDTTIVVGTTDDVLSEETETFVLTLQDPVGANLAVGAAEGTGTILDNDGTPTVSIEDAPSVTEGVDAVFAVKLSVASGQEVTVPYETSDATATAGQDYDAAVGGSLVIPAGKTDTTIVVGTIDDVLPEETETFTLTLQDPVGANLAVGAVVGTGTILDNDDAPTVSIEDAPSVTEGVDAVFAVKLSEASGQEVTVSYTTVDVTATAGQDYDAVVGGSLVIPAGKTDTTIVVGTTDDDLDEEDTETFTLVLSAPLNATLDEDEGTGTILDNDDAPTVSIEDAPSVTEGVDAVFAVKLNVASALEVTVPYETSDATATAGQDYDAVVGGSLVIPAGKTDTTIVVGTIDDVLSEETETFVLTLQDPVGANLAVSAAVGTGTILDNDDAPTVSIEDAPSVTEGVEAVFAVKLSVASALEVTVPYATSDVTATAGQDYEAAVGGSLVIPVGKTDTTIVVGTIDDAVSEETETFVLTLQDPVGADLAVGAAEGTGTIEDNDEVPTVSIEDAPSVTEGVEAVFAVRLSEASGREVTVPYATVDATATAGQDYEAAVGGSLVIPAGKTDTTIVVGTTDDVLSEETETFVLTLQDPVGADLAVGAAEGTGTILDNDGAPTVSIEDAPSVMEGVDAVFVVRLSVTSGQEVTVPYATSDATATAGQDYEAAVGGSLVIPAGKTDTTIVVGTTDDAVSEDTETFILTLQDPVGADLAVGAAEGTGTIEDNDDAPTVSIEDAPAVTEGGDAVFAVKLSVASGQKVTVPYATSDATATGGQDYEAVVGGSLVIPAGKTDTTIVVGTIDDAVSEDTETFILTLQDPVGADLAVGGAEGTGTIEDNDDAPTVSIEDADPVTEGVAAEFTVTLSEVSGRDVVVPYVTSDGTANSPGDYVAEPSGSVKIKAGETEVTIEVHTIDDVEQEEEETFAVTLSDPVGAALAVGGEAATGTILDNDGAPTVSIEDAPPVTEGGKAEFVVRLSVASGQEVTVPYATSDATATAGADYEAETAGSLTIEAGRTDTTIVLQTLDDDLNEESETFTVTLGEPVGAELAVGGEDGTGTILDNDDAPTVSIEDAPPVTEGGEAVFAVTLSGVSGRQVVVAYATGDGTATGGQDYDAAVGGSLVIPAGKADTTIAVQTIDDAEKEETETFEVLLGDVQGATIEEGRGVAEGTIEDNEGVSVRIADAEAVIEGGNATFAVTLSEASGQAVVLTYATRDVTAISPGDYAAEPNGSMTIEAGKTDTTIVVQTIDDTEKEEEETFEVVLTSAAGAGIEAGGSVGRGTIRDNDTARTVRIADAEVVTEGEVATFVLTLSGASNQAVVVGYATEDVTATSPGDYVAEPNGSVTIAVAETEVVIEVQTTDDTEREDRETFVVRLGDVAGATIEQGSGVAEGTIEDNEDISVRIADVRVAEDAGVAVFVVTLSAESDAVVTVAYATADGSAEAGLDYSSRSGTLTFAVGDTEKEIRVSITDDALDEEAETFEVRLSAPVGAVLSNVVATGTILDNEPSLRIDDVTVAEAAGEAVFKVTLSPQSNWEVTLAYATADGSAEAGLDYSLDSGTLTFAVGDTEKEIRIPITDDALDEEDETFTVTLTNPSSAGVTRPVATGTIEDDDAASSLIVEDLEVFEHEETASISVLLTSESQETVVVRYVTEDVTATAAAEDYLSSEGTLEFAPGQSLGQIEVGILEDGHVEGDETFRVFLSDAVHAGIADGEAVVTIRDNDVWSELRIGDAIAAEGGGTATFAVSLTPAAVEMVTVGYATADGSAEAGLDYTSGSGTLTFSAAETRKTFTVDVLEDTEVEQNETFTVELSDVMGARIALGIGVGTILDNDGISTLTVADMEVGEEIGTARVRVVLSPARGEEVTVAYATSDGTARQGEDYTAVTNTLSIPIGGEEGWIPIEITNDGIVEPDEAFTVTLSAPTHAILGNETATVAIVDDDLPVLSINNPFAPEHQGIMVFMLSLDQVRDEAVTVNYATMDVSATAGADYVSHAGIARIAAGALRQEIEVGIIEDAALESSETFEMVLSDARGAEIGVAVGRGTILDNDEYNMAIRDVEVEEDEGSAVFTVELDYRNTDQEVSVSYRTLAGTAEEDEDFHGESGRLVFAPGALRRQIQVSIVDDAEHEADEAFSVVLSQVENATLVDAEATATIRDNDLRKVDITGVTVVEGEGVARFAVNLDDATLKPVILVYQTLEGTAESGADYHSTRGALTFERGEIAKVIEVPVVDDGIDEPDETFTVLIGGALNAELMRSVATATILDDDEAPVVEVAGDVTVGEGDAAAVFTVTLRGRSAWPVEVEYETEDITAREGLDYTSASGRLSIPPGFGTGTLTVVVLEDEVDEPDEAFLLRLTGAERATLGSAQARGIIMDNDATPALRIDDVTVVESEASAVFTVGMSPASSERVLVNYATSDETATAGLDYVDTNGTLALEPGEVEAQITVPVELDGVDELDAETFLVTLSAAVAAEIADGEGRGTILDDDEPVSLSIFDVTVAEDAGMANFVVGMSQVSGKFVSVNFATSDETAQQGSDYTASNGIIVFEPGSQTGKIAVSIVDDVLDESAEETFKATLSNASNAVIARGEATGTILDNEGQPLLRVDDVTVSEEDGVASFRVWLSEPSSRMVMVGYRTVDGSAEAGADYEGQQGTVTFEPGQIEETIAVKLIRDGRDWATETFTLALESATHAQIEDPAATATIVEEGSVLGDVMAQWLARFSRTSAGHVASALEDRVQWLTSAPHCTPRMGSGIKHFRYMNPSWDPSVGELFSGCSMALKSARGQGEMSLWGRGAYTRFNGRDGQLSIKGNVSTAALGVDYLSPRGWLTGVLLAHSRGDGTFAAVDLEGEARSSLTGIYPYVRYGNTRRSVWGMAGYGTGTALLESEDSLESALDAVMGLAGMRVGLLKMGQAHVSYEADALVVRTTADNLDVLVHRVRAGLEGVLRLSQGWSPYVEASVRQDGGDAETGIGVEVAGGVRYAGNALKAEVTSRGLLAHASTGFAEWGVAGALHYGNAAGLGPAASIRPSWGTAHSGGMQALWRSASIEDALHGISGARRLELALGYGMPSIVGTGVARPVAAMTLQEQGREYRLGYEVAMRRYLNLSMEAVARTVAVNKRNYGVSVRGTMRW